MFRAYFYLFCAFMTVVFMYLSIQTSSAETNTVSSTVVNNTPPTANAPVLPNSQNDSCKVGIGGAVQNNILGIATGVLIDDELCQLLKLSKTQFAFGMQVSAWQSCVRTIVFGQVWPMQGLLALSQGSSGLRLLLTGKRTLT